MVFDRFGAILNEERSFVCDLYSCIESFFANLGIEREIVNLSSRARATVGYVDGGFRKSGNCVAVSWVARFCNHGLNRRQVNRVHSACVNSTLIWDNKGGGDFFSGFPGAASGQPFGKSGIAFANTGPRCALGCHIAQCRPFIHGQIGKTGATEFHRAV